ncbi:MAG: polymerase III DnaE protein, partial [Candidatus Woesebacteria bacterium GW2011_GWE1_41_24]
MSKFAHLHVHTEYSLLDGLSKIPKLITHIKDNSMDAVAITDHGVMYGSVEFYKEALKQGVKPIIGMEGYITPGKLTDRPARGQVKNHHIILLAKNLEGYQNLMKISSIAHLDGYYYRPRMDRELLAKYSKGIICTSACPMGEVGQTLLGGSYGDAKKVASWYMDTFKDDYYLEIQRHEFEKWIDKATNQEIKTHLTEMKNDESKWNEGVIKLSRDLGIPLIATNDAHYIKPEDAIAQDALVCISTGKTMGDTKRMRYIDAPTFYVRSPEEMEKLFPDVPDALENTVKIADKCNLEITLGKWYFPKFSLPEGVTADDELMRQSRELLTEKVPDYGKETKERLEYELDIICKKGYAPYFLIVKDMVKWANEEGIIT